MEQTCSEEAKISQTTEKRQRPAELSLEAPTTELPGPETLQPTGLPAG